MRNIMISFLLICIFITGCGKSEKKARELFAEAKSYAVKEEYIKAENSLKEIIDKYKETEVFFRAQEELDEVMKKHCMHNLKVIYHAEELYIIDNNLNPEYATIRKEDIIKYIKGNKFPKCPTGKEYIYSELFAPPLCPVDEHNPKEFKEYWRKVTGY